MNPPKNEILAPYFSKEEIKDLETNKPDKYKELLEKLKLSENKTQVELNALKQELDNLTLDEKIDKLLDFTKKTKEKKEPSKQEQKKIKKEAENKWFSWEKISKIVEKKWGWFSWAWFTAGISAFFSDFLGNLFNSAKKGASELVEAAGDLASWETNWTMEWNIYISEGKNFKLETTDNSFVKEIKIKWEISKIETNSRKQPKITEKSNKKYLSIWNDTIPLDRIWKVIDESKNSNEYIIDKTTLWGLKNATGIWDWLSRMSDDFELKLVKESSYWVVKENFINTWNTKIEFQERIEWKDFPIENVKIKKIEINWKKYKLEPEDQSFKLKKKWNKYFLSADLITFEKMKDFEIDDFEIDIRDIVNQINDKNKLDKSEKYYLFKSWIDIDTWINLFKWAEDLVADKTKLKIFLLKEIKTKN